MAKLNPKDPQFGIPVAARIAKETAFRLQADADKNNLSFSKHLSNYLEQAARNEAKLSELQTQITTEREVFKKAIGRFILFITDRNKEETTRFIQNYNTILKEEMNLMQSDKKTTN